MKYKEFLGIDIGASGIKGALVDVEKGEIIGERHRIPTPNPAEPKAVAKVFAEVVRHFNWEDKIVGCGFPAIVKKGVAHSAANIDSAWIGKDIAQLLSKYSNCPVVVRNDADVAGIAEMQFNSEEYSSQGTVIIITIGSGLGSALFVNGVLVPNTELGHFFLKGHNKIAEQYASDRVRKEKDLSWKVWGGRFNTYLTHLEKLFSPDLIILGGGSSKRFDRYKEYLTIETTVKPAQLLNHAGIIGAAVYAAQMKKKINTLTKA